MVHTLDGSRDGVVHSSLMGHDTLAQSIKSVACMTWNESAQHALSAQVLSSCPMISLE